MLLEGRAGPLQILGSEWEMARDAEMPVFLTLAMSFNFGGILDSVHDEKHRSLAADCIWNREIGRYICSRAEYVF